MSTKTNPLSEKDLQVLEEAAMLRAQGKTWAQLATELGTDGERLRKLVRRSGRVYWELFEEAQYRASMEAAARARATLTKLLNSEDERVALRAAQTLMADDRGRKKNAVLSEKNDISAGKQQKSRHRSAAFRQIDEAARTLTACRGAAGFALDDEEEVEPSLWQESYGGNGDGKEEPRE